MIFFITGASSFIGLELCRYLLYKGHEVIAMSRRYNADLEEISKVGKLSVFHSDMQSLADKLENVKADIFIHLAWAGTSHEERNNPDIHEENIRLSLECVKKAKKMGCKLYVDAGSQAEYGIVSGRINETTPCNPYSAYGKGKFKMYLESSVLIEHLGLKYIHLRIFSVYGERDHNETLIKSSLRKLKANEPVELQSGGQKWNYIYVKDAARQIAKLSIYAVENNAFTKEVYNIASNDTRKLSEFVESMRDAVGSSSELRFGGYNPYKDVNLNPDTKKVSAIVYPLTEEIFEEVIKKMI